MENIETFLENCQRDIKSIKTCVDCFKYWIKDRKNYFTRVCTKPHLLVFVKITGYPLWPAKVMSINGKMANVEFFDDHTQADIQLSKCFLYSEKCYTEVRNDKDFKDALKVNLHEFFQWKFQNIETNDLKI